MNIYPVIRVLSSAVFFILSLVILIDPEPLTAISPYVVEGRHLLIAFTGTLLYVGDNLISRVSDVSHTPCPCTC
jgi:hypothetical protein